jgi:hypothetical protein
MAWRGGFDGHCYSKDDFTKYVATISMGRLASGIFGPS